jgi:4-hydroxythreonine-4-phosphate dehydrogenase
MPTPSRRTKPVLAITMGDFNGTGPEVVLKSLRMPAVRALCVPVVIGSIDVLEYYARILGLRVNLRELDTLPVAEAPGIPVLPVRPFHLPALTPGRLSRQSGLMSGLAIEEAVRLCRAGLADAIVTAPVSKEAMHLAGYRTPGQTEMLLRLSGGKRVAMILAADRFRVALATVHHPIKDVARRLTKEAILEKLTILEKALRVDFAVRSPRIAALGLNPHAGENGILGSEERTVISPALATARRRGIAVEGPFPADAFFGLGSHRDYDAVLAMYHDQGLIPLKLEGFRIGVNCSAGLPIVRTSPDHGTAFDIAGKGKADPTSMVRAIRMAVEIATNRARHARRSR